MLAELPIQEAGAHLLSGDLQAAATALQRGTPLSAPIVDEFRSPVAAAWVAFLLGDLVFAGAALDRAAGAAAEHGEAAHGLGQIIANLVRAGIHLERREHQPAAALLAAAQAGARINGLPVVQTMVDTWTARLATAQGDRAGALASLAQARLALAAPDDSVRAQFALEEFRIALALEPAEAGAADPATAGHHRLKAAPGPAARPAVGVGESRADPGRSETSSLSANGRTGGRRAWQHKRPTSRGRTATCARPWRWPAPTGTWPPSSSRDPASPPCSNPCLPVRPQALRR